MTRGAAAILRIGSVFFTATTLAAAPAGGAAQQTEAPGEAQVIVIRAGNACFSAAIRVTGFLVARQDAVVQLGQGDRVVDLLVTEGARVHADQALARVSRQSPDPTKPGTMTTETVVLKSPAPGAVLKIDGVIGSTASPLQSEPLFQIAVDGEIELEAEVPSIYVPKLSAGQTARVRLPDMSELSGKVRLVPAAIDQKTQLGRARITLEHDPALRYGMFVSATINADRSCGVSVPNSAVTYRTGGASVQVVNNDIIETRNIEIGIRSDSDIEVRKGLSEGDLVVGNAGTSLRDGDRVKPIAGETTRDGRL